MPAAQGERKEENPARHHFPSNKQRAFIVLKRLPKLHPNLPHITQNVEATAAQPKQPQTQKANSQQTAKRTCCNTKQKQSAASKNNKNPQTTPKNNKQQQKAPKNH